MQYLVLGPGGSKGFLQLGALFYLYEQGFLDKIHTYVGVSVGSIISLLLNCGYRPSQIIVKTILYNLFTSCTIRDVWNNVKSGSLLSIEPIRAVLNQLMREKFGRLLSMKELHEKTGRTLITVANDISSAHGLRYLSYKTDPDLLAVEAAIMSSSIPFIFPKYEYKKGIYIDGASINPYPVDAIPLSEEKKILGLYIDNQDEKEVGNSRTAFLSRVIESPLREIYRRNLSAYKGALHVRLCSEIHDSVGLTLEIEDKGRLIVEGYEQAKKEAIKK